MNESFNKKSRQKKKMNNLIEWWFESIHHFFITNTIDFNYIKITYQKDCVILLLLIKKFVQKIEFFTTFWLNKIIDVKVDATIFIYRLLSNNKKTTYRRKTKKFLLNFLFFFCSTKSILIDDIFDLLTNLSTLLIFWTSKISKNVLFLFFVKIRWFNRIYWFNFFNCFHS